MCKSRAIVTLLGVLAIVSTANAQFWDRLTNPTVEVLINHPPGLGVNVNKIAFGPATGECADELVDALISDFVTSGIEVMDRQNLTAIMAEHNLSSSGHFDQASTAEMGRILGPTTMVFVRVTRCETLQDRLQDTEQRYNSKTKSTYTVRAFYARTRAFLKASIQVVDLATGKIFAARTLEYTPERSNKSYQGYPEMPATFDVMDVATQEAVGEVHRMLLPWSETTKLVYYDDKDCGLKQAFQHMKFGNTDAAFEQSLVNLESCNSNPSVKDKVRGHAYYNVGISYMIRNEYDTALEFLQQAEKIAPGEIVTQAIADCQKARQLSVEVQQLATSIAVEPGNALADGQDAAQPKAASALTNADVIQMVRSKLPDAVIIHKIQNSKRSFDTTPAGLAELTKAGVNEAVLIKMISP